MLAWWFRFVNCNIWSSSESFKGSCISSDDDIIDDGVLLEIAANATGVTVRVLEALVLVVKALVFGLLMLSLELFVVNVEVDDVWVMGIVVVVVVIFALFVIGIELIVALSTIVVGVVVFIIVACDTSNKFGLVSVVSINGYCVKSFNELLCSLRFKIVIFTH